MCKVILIETTTRKITKRRNKMSSVRMKGVLEDRRIIKATKYVFGIDTVLMIN